jgi:hypothetical protein
MEYKYPKRFCSNFAFFIYNDMVAKSQNLNI